MYNPCFAFQHRHGYVNKLPSFCSDFFSRVAFAENLPVYLQQLNRKSPVKSMRQNFALFVEDKIYSISSSLFIKSSAIISSSK